MKSKRRARSVLISFGAFLLVLVGALTILLYQVWAQTLIRVVDRDLERASLRMQHVLSRPSAEWEPELRRLAWDERVGCRLFVNGEPKLFTQFKGIAFPEPAMVEEAAPVTQLIGTTKIRFLEIRQGDMPGGWVLQIAKPWWEITEPLHRMRSLLLWLVPPILLLALLLLRRLVNRMMEPLESMAQVVAEIQTDRLSQRVTSPGSGDELDVLAEAFNHMMDRLETSFSDLSHFADEVSHELRTPLSRMRIKLEHTLNQAPSNQVYADTLTKVHEQTLYLSQMVERLLSLSRKEVLMETLPLVSPAELTSDLRELLEALAEDKQQTVSVVPFPEMGMRVRGDLQLLFQMLSNLVENATRHTPQGGRIHLQSGISAPDRWRLILSNTGKPLTSAQWGTMQKSFVKGEASQGKGLGLPICLRIAQVHSGSLHFSSWTDENRPDHLVNESFPEGNQVIFEMPLVPQST